jgi:hypothetical protein
MTASWGFVIAAMALNGVTQIVKGGPGYVNVDRWLRKRTPATPHDFVLQGAAQVVQALGNALIAAPVCTMSLLATVDLTTGWHIPPPPEVPMGAGIAIFGAYLCSLCLSATCAFGAYRIRSKIKYVPVSRAVNSLG